MTASEALVRAMIAALRADPAIAAAVRGVWDAPPPGARPPYLTVGPDIVTDWSHKTGEGREHRLRVGVLERPLAVAAAHQLVERVESVAAGIRPSLDGHRLVQLRFLRGLVNAGGEDAPVEGIIEFRARTERA